MDNQLWEKVDDYLETALDGRDDVLSEVLFSSREAGLPAIQVSAMQGKFLHVLARLIGARRVLEIGALGGYSAIWLGRALPPEGKLVSLEVDARHAEVARANIDRAGLSALAEVRVGPALAALPGLVEEFGEGSFDLSFIDADKRNNPAYFRWALRLTRPGGAIVVDNVVRQGRVADTAAALQTVGSKGYDGFAIAFVGIPQPSEVAS